MALPFSDTRRQTVRVHAIMIASSITCCKSMRGIDCLAVSDDANATTHAAALWKICSN